MQVCVSSIALPDHFHVTIGEDKTLEHMSAVNKDVTFNELKESFTSSF